MRDRSVPQQLVFNTLDRDGRAAPPGGPELRRGTAQGSTVVPTTANAVSGALGSHVASGSMAEHLRSLTVAQHITPTPPEGFPLVYLNDPLALHANQKPLQLADWEDPELFPGGKVLATIYGSGALPHRVDDSIPSLETALANEVNTLLNARAKVSIPAPVDVALL